MLVVPADHERAGKSISLAELKNEPLVLMQEGAGIRQMIDEELARASAFGCATSTSSSSSACRSRRARLSSAASERRSSRALAIEGDLAAGTLALVRVEGLEPEREIQLARATGRAETRAAQAFVAYARERLA